MTQARSHIVSKGQQAMYHCVTRCVRRAWLWGVEGQERVLRHFFGCDRIAEQAGRVGLDAVGMFGQGAMVRDHRHRVGLVFRVLLRHGDARERSYSVRATSRGEGIERVFPDGPATRKLQSVPIPMSIRSPSSARPVRHAGGTGVLGRPVAPAGAGILLLAMAACGSGLYYRSVAELSGEVPIGQGVTRVRFEVQDGTIGVDSGTARVVEYRGGVRRAGDTAANLSRLEQIPLQLTASVDPADPSVLVVRGPMRDETGPEGVFAFELGIRVPPEAAV